MSMLTPHTSVLMLTAANISSDLVNRIIMCRLLTEIKDFTA